MRIAGRWDRKPQGTHYVGEFGPNWYTHIYAIAPKGGGCVKFGLAANVKSRFSGIQTGSPVKLELLGSVYVPFQVETEIHSYLKEHRSHGEWFYPTVLVMKVAGIIASGDKFELVKELAMFGLVPNHQREQINFEERMTTGPRSL